MSETAADQLTQFVETLPEPALRKLAATIELDRGENRFGLPHDVIMQLLRPRLAEIRAPRVFTAQRMLCVPFEDMLVIEHPGYKQVGKIQRKTIMPMWDVLTGELLTDRWPGLADEFLDAQKENDDERSSAAASAIWAAASEALQAFVAEQESDPDILRKTTKRLGGTIVFEDMKEMACTLEIADILESVKSQLPRKPIQTFTDEQVNVLKRHYDRVAQEHEGREIYYLMAIMGRLLQPFPILKLFRALTRKLDDTLASKSDLAVAGNMVIEALEEDARKVAAVIEEEDTTEEDVMSRTRRFAAAFKGITADIGVRRDGEWGKRMYASRNLVSQAVERMILSDAPRAILSVLPRSKGTNAYAPDFSGFPDEEKFERAERRARALGEAANIAEEIGLQSACSSTVNSLRKDFDGYAARIIERLPRTTEEEKPAARAHLATAVRLIELISSSDDADLLRRRGGAALEKKTTG